MAGAWRISDATFRLMKRALCLGDPDRPFEDADCNASWIGEEGENEKPHHNDGETYNKDERGEDDDKCVTLIRVQW